MKVSTVRITDQPSRHACSLVFSDATSSILHFSEPRRGSLTPGSHKVVPHPSDPPSVTSRPRSGKEMTFELAVPPASSLAYSISRSSKRGRIVGLRLVAISTILCAQKSSSRRVISENFTISSHRVSPSTSPVIYCRPFESNLTLKIVGFHHMSFPTTAGISRLVTLPRVRSSMHEVAKICTLSRGTQNSIVTVSNPRPRKNSPWRLHPRPRENATWRLQALFVYSATNLHGTR